MSDSADDDLNAPPLKKARYQWQVKNSKSSQRCENSDKLEDENCHPSQFLENISNNDSNACENCDSEDHNTSSESKKDNSESESEMYSYDGESTDLKILDTVRKYVNGQTSKLVQNVISKYQIQSLENSNTNKASCLDEQVTSQTIVEKQDVNKVEEQLNDGNNSDSVASISSSADTVNTNTSVGTTDRTSNEHEIPPSLDYITRWQSQQKAKAIVDNAINMTLEEMGLTPNLEQNVPILERRHVEDESISEAIRHRGLYPQENNDNALQGTITPLLQQLSEVSDTVFADRLNSMRLFITIRQTSRNPADAAEIPLEWTDELAIRTVQGSNTSNQTNGSVPIPNQAFQLSLNTDHPITNHNDSSLYLSDNPDEVFDDEYYAHGDALSEMHSSRLINTNDIGTNNSQDIESRVEDSNSENSENHDSSELDKETETSQSREVISDSDIMNYAVNAAISAKGLAVKHD